MYTGLQIFGLERTEHSPTPTGGGGCKLSEQKMRRAPGGERGGHSRWRGGGGGYKLSETDDITTGMIMVYGSQTHVHCTM